MRIFIKYISDLLIYIISFIIVFYLKYGNLDFTNLHNKFIIAYFFSWLFSTILSGKLHLINNKKFIYAFRPFIISFFLMAGFLTFFSYFLKFEPFSRFIIAGCMLLALSIELLFVWTRTPIDCFTIKKLKRLKAKRIYIYEILILLVMEFLIFKDIINDFLTITLSLFFSWLLAGISTHKFRLNTKVYYGKFIWNHIKSYILMIFLTTFILFMLRFPENIRIEIIKLITFYSIISFVMFSYFYFKRIPPKTDEARLKFLKPTNVSDELVKPHKITSKGIYSLNKNLEKESVRDVLKNDYLKNISKVFDEIESKVDLKSIDRKKSFIIKSDDPYNVEILHDNSLELFFNLHKFNDIRRLNKYFIAINKKLINGGLYIGNFEPIKFRHNRFLQKYPYFLAQFLYFFDFLWKRVTPKLPILQKIYFALTNGKDRAISFAEGMGRLIYCGFDIIKIFEFQNKIFFIAVKVKKPLRNITPSYGPIIKMKRIGKDGKIINIYKLRTMHPFSEYLQELVYKIYNIDNSGKFKDDFRITSWGKIFRKLWIDELPMIYNLFKGELKIVGVRPLTQHYFSLYDEDLKKLRIKTKPGLVPPYYADLPKTFKEIMDSERKYLNSYFQNPIATDVRYFFKAMYNIIIKKARSK